jgi:D-3-phosphoglycerate dehydrogenase
MTGLAEAPTRAEGPRHRIAVLDDYLRVSQSAADWSALAERAEIVVFDRPMTLDQAASDLADFDILCTLRERQPFPRALIERLPRLRYLCVTGKRYDTIDIAAAAERGVVVSNTPVSGAGAGGVTELTWGLIIALARHIATEGALMREGGWQHTVGSTLRGKRLGVVGLGGIGADVARIGAAFGMEVVAWSPNLTPERAQAAGVRGIGKIELFETSDVVTLHLALADSTRGAVGKAELGSMKPSARLVNTARAGLVDEAALVDVLERGAIAGAALDVFSVEPLPEDHVLRRLPNIILTPHLGYMTEEMLSSYYKDAVENICSYLDGAPIRVVSDRP